MLAERAFGPRTLAHLALHIEPVFYTSSLTSLAPP